MTSQKISFFRPIARNLSLFLLSLLLFFLSFNFWADLPTLTPSEVSSVWQQDWQVLWDLLLLMSWAMWGWWQLGKSANDSAWRLDSNSYGIAGIFTDSRLLYWVAVIPRKRLVLGGQSYLMFCYSVWPLDFCDRHSVGVNV